MVSCFKFVGRRVHSLERCYVLGCAHQKLFLKYISTPNSIIMIRTKTALIPVNDLLLTARPHRGIRVRSAQNCTSPMERMERVDKSKVARSSVSLNTTRPEMPRQPRINTTYINGHHHPPHINRGIFIDCRLKEKSTFLLKTQCPDPELVMNSPPRKSPGSSEMRCSLPTASG